MTKATLITLFRPLVDIYLRYACLGLGYGRRYRHGSIFDSKLAARHHVGLGRCRTLTIPLGQPDAKPNKQRRYIKRFTASPFSSGQYCWPCGCNCTPRAEVNALACAPYLGVSVSCSLPSSLISSLTCMIAYSGDHLPPSLVIASSTITSTKWKEDLLNGTHRVRWLDVQFAAHRWVYTIIHSKVDCWPRPRNTDSNLPRPGESLCAVISKSNTPGHVHRQGLGGLDTVNMFS